MAVELVVGGSSGIGAAVVRRLAERGDRVWNLDRKAPERADGARFVETDVASATSVRDALSQLDEPLEGWVQAAGIQIGIPIEEMSDDEIARQIAVNLTGACLSAKYVSPHLADGASAVLVSSELAFIGSAQSPVYTATKGALVSLARSLAVAWRHRRIRVNALCPGATDTPLLRQQWDGIPDPEAARKADEAAVLLGRFALPEEIANVCAFLLSAESSFVDGHALVADGGTIAW